MRSLESGKKIIGVLVVVAIGQVIGWGTVGLLAVVGRQVGADLGMDISAVFAGNSIFYVATGLSAPLLAKAFIRFGARRVMIAGTIVSAPGFVLLSQFDRPRVVLRRMDHPRHGRQRDVGHRHLHPAQ